MSGRSGGEEAFAEFERSMIQQRVRAGLKVVRDKWLGTASSRPGAASSALSLADQVPSAAGELLRFGARSTGHRDRQNRPARPGRRGALFPCQPLESLRCSVNEVREPLGDFTHSLQFHAPLVHALYPFEETGGGPFGRTKVTSFRPTCIWKPNGFRAAAISRS